MRTRNIVTIALALVAGYFAANSFTALADDTNGPRIQVLDDCLPGDALWNPTGGCTLHPTQGDVSFAEFLQLLTAPTVPTNTSPAGVQLVGHPSWRNEPSHSTVNDDKTLHIVNNGGRAHTFTKVANFGGGFIGDLNFGLVRATECSPGAVVRLNPGDRESIDTSALGPGLHKFQCCIHPWMRATVRVEE